MKWISGLTTLVVIGMAYFYGVYSYENHWFPYPALRWVKNNVQTVVPPGYNSVVGRVEVSCENFRKEGAAIILTLGQSNAGNHGDTPHVPFRDVFNLNWFDARCYLARDPLLGPTGNGGSVWSRLGEMLVHSEMFKEVLFVPIAVGGTSVSDWTPNGTSSNQMRIDSSVRTLRKHGLKITHVLWHQGETDAARGMSGETYMRHLTNVIKHFRQLGVDAPFFVARASVCGSQASNKFIRKAQLNVARRFDNVFSGPDTDELNQPYHRYDGCHFSIRGLDEHAKGWFDALRL